MAALNTMGPAVQSEKETPPLSRECRAGLAAVLVALPAAIAYGVSAYALLGPEFAAAGAAAGFAGAVVLGLAVPAIGGARMVISAPSAPAAVLMAGLVGNLTAGTGNVLREPPGILALLTLAAAIAGGLQIVFGLVGVGRLIKYIPFPVVSGYLSGVGFLILLGELPKFFGFPKSIPVYRGVTDPALWHWPSIVIGAVTIGAVVLAPRLTSVAPPAIVGLLAGSAGFWAVQRASPDIDTAHMTIGEIHVGLSALWDLARSRLDSLSGVSATDVGAILLASVILSILLSIDSLKTCVVVDALTRTRHNSARVLVAQGTANILSAVAGGLPGSATMGATMVNVTSGGRSRLSGTFEGLFALAGFVFLGGIVGAIPLAALAGVLIDVAFRMIDRQSVYLLRQRSTILDFAVIAAVALTAVQFNLIAAAGVGTGLSILLFIRAQASASVVRRKLTGLQISSKQHRHLADKEILRREGHQITICQLQGSLFFGTTDQLFTEVEPDLKNSRYLILDMARVQLVDFTAVHVLDQIESMLQERHGHLVFANLPVNLPTGQNLKAYFRQLELVAPRHAAKVFPTLDDALVWAEDHVLDSSRPSPSVSGPPLDLGAIELLRGLSPEALSALRACAIEKSLATDETVFRNGDSCDELFIVRRGAVKIVLNLADGRKFHLTTFARGHFFGEMAFLDGGKRSADAIATAPTELYAISRARFDAIASEHSQLSILFQELARTLALRLRYTNDELRAAQEA